MIIGHERVAELLYQELPPAVLLLGPPSVGKRTLAEHVARHHGVHKADLIMVRQLRATDARNIVRYADTWPHGPFKMVIVRLDGALPGALNSLLKVVEEPPPSIRFILLATELPLSTIVSRCVLYRCGLLTDSQVADVLRLTGMAPPAAERLAPLGSGHVLDAMEAGQRDGSKSAVQHAIKAVHAKDPELLSRTLRRWDELSQELLVVWAYEAAAGRWRLFSASRGERQEAVLGRKLLLAMAGIGPARARTVAQNVLKAACLER